MLYSDLLRSAYSRLALYCRYFSHVMWQFGCTVRDSQPRHGAFIPASSCLQMGTFRRALPHGRCRHGMCTSARTAPASTDWRPTRRGTSCQPAHASMRMRPCTAACERCPSGSAGSRQTRNHAPCPAGLRSCRSPADGRCGWTASAFHSQRDGYAAHSAPSTAQRWRIGTAAAGWVNAMRQPAGTASRLSAH